MPEELCLPPVGQAEPAPLRAGAGQNDEAARARKPRGVERLITAAASPAAQLLIRAGWIALLTMCVKVAALGKDVFLARAVRRRCPARLLSGRLCDSDVRLERRIAIVLAGIHTDTGPSAQHAGLAEATALIRSTLARVASGLLLLAVVLSCLPRWIMPLVASGFDAEELDLATRLCGILVWIVPLSGMSSLLGGILNCFDCYVLVALVPIVMPLTMLAAILAFVPQYGVEALAWGAVIAFGLELMLLVLGTWRWKLPLLPAWRRHADERRVMGEYGHLFVGAILMSSSSLVDQSMATWLGAGSVSILSYGNKLTALLLGTISLALGAAVFPHFSRLAASADARTITGTIHSLGKVVALAAIAGTVVLMILSRPLVELFFQRGAMTPEMIAAIASVQRCYLLQVPPYIVNTMNVRMLIAHWRQQDCLSDRGNRLDRRRGGKPDAAQGLGSVRDRAVDEPGLDRLRGVGLLPFTSQVALRSAGAHKNRHRSGGLKRSSHGSSHLETPGNVHLFVQLRWRPASDPQFAACRHRGGHPARSAAGQGRGSAAPEVPPEVRIIDFNVAKLQHAIPKIALYLRRERPRASSRT